MAFGTSAEISGTKGIGHRLQVEYTDDKKRYMWEPFILSFQHEKPENDSIMRRANYVSHGPPISESS
jgi:hypothetical protein